MFASLAASGHKSARAVVAGWLIAVQVLLTASVGAVFCGAGSATEAGPEVIAADSVTANQNYVIAAAEAAANAADAMGRIELEAAILDTETGQLALGGRAAIPMLSASLSKLIVAVDIVDRRRADGLVVDPFAIELIRQALGPSDDLAMNELWTGFDGAGAVDRVASRLGLTGTVMPEDPSIWGEVTVTAADIARIYRHVLAMPPADRDLISGRSPRHQPWPPMALIKISVCWLRGPPARSPPNRGGCAVGARPATYTAPASSVTKGGLWWFCSVVKSSKKIGRQDGTASQCWPIPSTRC